ncbi:MAG: baseplate J/gp47 family protein, partial [Cyanobacteriota bacterium]
LEPCFWRRELAVADSVDPGPGPGFGVASRLLALAEGERCVTLTLRFQGGNGSPEALLASLRPPEGQPLQADGCAGLPPLAPDRPGWGLNQALLVEVSTAEGWWETSIARASARAAADPEVFAWELALELALTPADPPLAPLTDGEPPRLRLRLRPWREPLGGAQLWRSWTGLDGLRPVGARLRVEVRGIKGVRVQQEGAAVDPREPFTPFGSNPSVGQCLYISHPELVEGDLEGISFAGRWQQVPADLTAHYRAYRGWPGLAPGAAVTTPNFQMDVSLRTRHGGVERELRAQPLFADGGHALHIRCSFPPGPANAQPVDTASGAAEDSEDLREQARVWRWRLTPTDFGHGLYPALAARKAQELAVAISGAAGRQALALAEAMAGGQGSVSERYDAALQAAGATPINPDDFAVPEPYTPLLADLEVGYSRVRELGATAADQLLRVHLFGEEEPIALPAAAPADGAVATEEAPSLLPHHPHPGELWLELEGTRPRQPLALAFQLAEGTARGARPIPAVRWEARHGWRWRPLPVREDATNGLLHSGILRFTLPEDTGERLWIRACLLAPVEAYATVLAIQSQAVEAEAIPIPAEAGEEADEEDAEGTAAGVPGTAPVHQPLPPHSITALEEGMPEIGAIHQPFSSRAGRAAETEAELRMRVAERLRHKDRALAGWDYERLLWEGFASQLHTVVCQPAREGEPVTVVVIPDLRQQVPRNLFAPGAPTDQLAAMERHLRERCPAEVELVVRNATYLAVMARLWVCLREGVDPAHAERELREALIRVLSPWCFDASAEVRLGGEVRASDVAAAIDALPFVAYLERLRLFLVDPGGKPLRFDGLETSSEDILRAPAPDVVLIAAPIQAIEFVSATSTQPSLIGIGAMRIELDFQVA